MEEWIDIVQNKYLVAFYAVIVWYAFHFVIHKDKEDDKNGSFKISRWWKKIWDNVFLTFLVATFVVLFDAEILWLFNFYQGDEKFNACQPCAIKFSVFKLPINTICKPRYKIKHSTIEPSAAKTKLFVSLASPAKLTGV